MTFDFDKEISQHLAVIKELERKPGVFTASLDDTFYDKAWLRDIYFITLGFFETGDIETTKNAAKALLTVFVKHKDKINWAVENKPHYAWQYIHARFHPETFEEYWEEWGNSQNDAVGEVLNLICTLELMGESVVETDDEKAMVQKIIDYLVTIEYWEDDDNGIWEENLEVHASSIGSCIAALKKAKEVNWLTVPEFAVENGELSLRALLPRESATKFADLALLTLIYPFQVTSEEETLAILRNVEYHLVRDKGVIRYKLDRYYNNNSDGYSEEAEWCFGLSWLAIIYAERGEKDKAYFWLRRAKAAVTEDGKVPELYYSHTDKPNDNTPLGWAESMYVVALQKVKEMG
ncbi:glycoside hydrolase family 15 [Candidatus Nomurabacteria bacterium]|nr:glycoside hydrolase family 15 [Candidatus Kaiserbacteria bacterium]MCB9815542.1 glycoside hydrolase family 15 [Candidatus Nomurabacteria bacterium]